MSTLSWSLAASIAPIVNVPYKDKVTTRVMSGVTFHVTGAFSQRDPSSILTYWPLNSQWGVKEGASDAYKSVF